MPHPTPDRSAERVRTLSKVPSCPDLRSAPLTGLQTVCSGKCRIARSRRQRAQKQADREAAIRLKLREAMDFLADEDPPPQQED
jgi:hypothetical protein